MGQVTASIPGCAIPNAGAARIAALRGVPSQNAFFNREVTRADLGGDGIISDREAIRYAGR